MAKTINDIALAAGVSKATVSAVLNNRSSVSDGTRERVLDVMREHQYHPRAAARLRREAGKPLVGLIVKEIDNPFFAEVAAGVLERARASGYTAVVVDSQGDAAEEIRLVLQLREQGVGGLVIAPTLDPRDDISHLYDLKREGYPFVLLESAGHYHLKANIVDVDNVSASKQAVSHLIELGHTHILHFSGPPYSAHSRERVEGVRRAFSESSLVFSEDLVVPTGFRAEDGYRMAIETFAERPTGPVGITCFNDLVALGVWQALLELGLRVPEDVSLIGYDDLNVLGYLPVSLTTVHTPNREMGTQAADILLRHMEAPEGLAPERRTLDASLVERASTQAVRRAQVTASDGQPVLYA